MENPRVNVNGLAVIKEVGEFSLIPFKALRRVLAGRVPLVDLKRWAEGVSMGFFES